MQSGRLSRQAKAAPPSARQLPTKTCCLLSHPPLTRAGAVTAYNKVGTRSPGRASIEGNVQLLSRLPVSRPDRGQDRVQLLKVLHGLRVRLVIGFYRRELPAALERFDLQPLEQQPEVAC